MPVEKIKQNEPEEAGKEAGKQPTLKEILDDKELSRGFNKWMEAQGKESLMVKMLKGETENRDLLELSEERRKFLERRSQEKVMENVLLSDENLKGFIERSPEMERIGELVGKEGIREALKQVLQEKALANENDTTHEDFFGDYLKWVEASDKYANSKKALDEILASVHLNASEANYLADIEDKEEKKRVIEQIWKEKGLNKQGSKGWLMWKKPAWTKEQLEFLNWTAEEFSHEIKDDGGRTDWSLRNQGLEEATKKVADSKRELTESLGIILSEYGSREVGRILTAGEKPKEKTVSFEEMKRATAEAQSTESAERQFMEYAEEEYGDFVVNGKFDLADSYQREISVDNFFNQYREDLLNKASGKGGLWAAIYRAIIEPFLDEFLPELKKQTQVDKDKKRIIMKKKKK